MTQFIPRDDVPLEVICEGALEETAQALGTGQNPAQPSPGPAQRLQPARGDWGDGGVQGEG